MAEMLTALAIYHVYEQEGDDYLEVTQNRRMPWVLTRDIRGTVTRDVIAGFDRLFQESVALLQEAWNANEEVRKGMKERIEGGEFNPALDFVKNPKMKNAVGTVLLRQVEIREGLIGPEAFEKAVEKMDTALKEMEVYVNEVLSTAGAFVVQEMQRHSLRPVDVNALDVRIRAIDENGPLVEFNVDEATVFSNDQKEAAESNEKGQGTNGFNPMYG